MIAPRVYAKAYAIERDGPGPVRPVAKPIALQFAAARAEPDGRRCAGPIAADLAAHRQVG